MWIAGAGIWVLVAVVAATAPDTVDASKPTRPTTEAERRQIFAEVIRGEPAARRRTERHFPGDRWSQDDDFHNWEQRMAHTVAERRGIDLSEVYRAIDEGLREGWAPELEREATAAPLKPRPFYD